MTSFAGEPDFPCGSCKQNVADNHAAVQCDTCSQWFHAHCQNISAPQYADYAGLQSFSWLCLDWFSQFQFSALRVAHVPASLKYVQ